MKVPPASLLIDPYRAEAYARYKRVLKMEIEVPLETQIEKRPSYGDIMQSLISCIMYLNGC